MKFAYCASVALAALLFAACSSAPRDPGDILDARRTAEAQLERGNKQVDRGEPEFALFFIDDAVRLAVLTDDPGLSARAGLSRANALLALGRLEEAEAAWSHALSEALLSGNRELVALARIHVAWGRFRMPGAPIDAQSVLDEVMRERGFLRDQFFVAFAASVEARAEGELGRFDRAEAAARRSLATHERTARLELAANDWFMIASFRSRSGNFAGARSALESSIELNRRVENSWGLAASWRAMGDVERRAGNLEAARAAYARSAGIFRALGHEQAAQEALSRID